MNCNDYQAVHNLTDAQMCRLLNDARPSPADSPFFEHRFRRMKSGKSPTKEKDLMILQLATNDEADSYS